MTLKLVIFDLDGVITSTTDAHFQAWNHLFENHFDITLEPELERFTKGVSRLASLNVLLLHYDLSVDQHEISTLAEEKNRHYRQMISHYDPSHLMPGVIPLLDALQEADIKIALGSASRNGPLLLDRLGIKDRFDLVVDPAGLPGKPDPAIFMAATHHFKLAAHACIGIEDAEAGIRAIKQAGMKAIGIGKDILPGADLQVLDLSALNIEIMSDLIER